MLSVADELGIDVLPLGRGADDAGPAVVDGGHGVVQVRQVRGAGLINGAGLIVAGVCMGHRHGAESGCFFGKVRGARQFRRQVHDADQAAAVFIELLKGGKIRGAEIGPILGAFLFFREEGYIGA